MVYSGFLWPNDIVWALMMMQINDDADFSKGMKYCTSGTDVALQFSWVSVHANEQTLTIDVILDMVCRCLHNWM